MNLFAINNFLFISPRKSNVPFLSKSTVLKTIVKYEQYYISLNQSDYHNIKSKLLQEEESILKKQNTERVLKKLSWK